MCRQLAPATTERKHRVKTKNQKTQNQGPELSENPSCLPIPRVDGAWKFKATKLRCSGVCWPQTQRTRRPLGGPSDLSARWQLWKDVELWRRRGHCRHAYQPHCMGENPARAQNSAADLSKGVSAKKAAPILWAAEGAHPQSVRGTLIRATSNNHLTRLHSHCNLTGLEVYPIFGVPTEAADANF